MIIVLATLGSKFVAGIGGLTEKSNAAQAGIVAFIPGGLAIVAITYFNFLTSI